MKAGDQKENVPVKAVVRERYGPPRVLEFREVERPTPKESEVLVRVYAASINRADLYAVHPPFVIRLLISGAIRRPKELTFGSDIAGRVEAVGEKVTRFRPGDQVFGAGRGAFAEFVVAREDRLVAKPSSVSFEECACIPVAGTTALQGLRKGGILPGEKVLIDGASGGVGTFAVQMAKSMRAEVTAVCSTKNVESARAIGADYVIDYTKENFAKSGKKYDLILGINGFRSLLGYGRVLSPKGTYILIGSRRPLTAITQVVLFGSLFSRVEGRKMRFMGIAKMNPEDLIILKEMLEQGKIRSLIDRRYPMNHAAEAFKYFEERHVGSKVVLVNDSAVAD